MSPTTIVIGENLVDLLVHPDRIEGVIGGGPLNVARTIARLGGDVSFLSGISQDAFGVQIADALRADGVNLVGPVTSPLPTTLAIVTMDELSPKYHFHLNGTAAFAISAPVENVPACMYLGTLGLLLEPMASIGEAMIVNADPSTVTIVDPNCRPSAVQDRDAFLARLSRLYGRTDVVKVSVEDLDYLSPELSHVDAARAILAAGATVVLVTDGPGPVRLIHADYDVTIPVPATEIVDTVGAGDSLTGGFITWWLGHGAGRGELGDAELVTRAVAGAIEISRRTCQQPGAQPPFARDVTALPEWNWL